MTVAGGPAAAEAEREVLAELAESPMATTEAVTGLSPLGPEDAQSGADDAPVRELGSRLAAAVTKA